MSAYLLVNVVPKNQEKLEEYVSKVAPLIGSAGGEIAMRGKTAEVLAGQHSAKVTAVVRFSDMSALKAWWDSDEYKALIPVREEGADMTIVALDDYPLPG